MTTGGYITNNSPNTSDFYHQMFAAKYSATGVGGIEVLPQTQDVLDPWTSVHGPQFYNDVESGETVQFGPGSANSGVRTLIDSTDVEIISQFVDDNSSGTDQFGYDFNTEIATSFSGGGANFLYEITTTADAELSVTYFFGLEAEADELPAPGGLGFVLLGLMAIGAARRRLIR